MTLKTKCQECSTNVEMTEYKPMEDNSIKGINDRTFYYFYQCPKCSTKWKNIKESGIGGHGSIWEKIS